MEAAKTLKSKLVLSNPDVLDFTLEKFRVEFDQILPSIKVESIREMDTELTQLIDTHALMLRKVDLQDNSKIRHIIMMKPNEALCCKKLSVMHGYDDVELKASSILIENIFCLRWQSVKKNLCLLFKKINLYNR